MSGRRASKQRAANDIKPGGAARLSVQRAAEEADAAIAKAKLTGDTCISDSHNSNRSGTGRDSARLRRSIL